MSWRRNDGRQLARIAGCHEESGGRLKYHYLPALASTCNLPHIPRAKSSWTLVTYGDETAP